MPNTARSLPLITARKSMQTSRLDSMHNRIRSFYSLLGGVKELLFVAERALEPIDNDAI
jgi:hypothetical protein